MSLLVSVVLAAQAAAAPVPELLAPFGLLDLPSCAGKRFVGVARAWWKEPGPLDWLPVGESCGWLLSLDNEQCTLLDEHLRVSSFTRRTEPVHARPWRSGLGGDVAPGIWERDFAAYCRSAIAEAAPGEPVPMLRFLLLAWWAHQHGLPELRDELVRFVRGRNVRRGTTLVSELASNIRWRAQHAAQIGRPRRELLALWDSLERVSGPDLEAGRMIASYETLLVEDALFREPTAVELASMPAADQVEVWFHRLRDVDMCISSMFAPRPSPEPEETHATTRALTTLGWHSIPGLIRRLDDERPTRSLESRRFVGGQVLLTHADWSRRLLEVITGRAFETRAEAERWWAYKPDAEQVLLSRLASDERDLPCIVRQLLARDPDKHLRRVAALIAASDARRRAELAMAFAPYATHAHLRVLESLLDLDDPARCLDVARELARLGAPMRGVERMGALVSIAAGELAAAPPFDLCDQTAWVDEAVAFVRAHDRCRAERSILDLLDAERGRVRLRGFAAARRFPSPEVLARLAALLDDPTPTGWAVHYEIRACDAAAEALAAVLGLAERFRLTGDPIERERTIAALREHRAELRAGRAGPESAGRR